MKLIPNGDRILVKPLEEEQREVGGILLVQNSAVDHLEGEVIAVGSGYRLEDGGYAALDFEEGDKVLYSPYTGNEIVIGAQKYVILRDSEIMAKGIE